MIVFSIFIGNHQSWKRERERKETTSAIIIVFFIKHLFGLYRVVSISNTLLLTHSFHSSNDSHESRLYHSNT